MSAAMEQSSEPSSSKPGEGSQGRSWSSKLPFPTGLKVLVVDDDPLCLKVVEQMLRKCDYEGARRPCARAALSLGGRVQPGRPLRLA